MYSLQSIILWACLAIAYSTLEMNPEFPQSPVFKKCLTKLKMDNETFPEYLRDHINDASLDKETLCFLKCISEEMGTLDKNGLLDIKKIKSDGMLQHTINATRPIDQVFECMEKMKDPVLECEDMEKLRNCVM